MSSEIIKWTSGETRLVFENISDKKDLNFLPDNAIIIIDQNVYAIYQHLVKNHKVLLVNATESIKSLESIQNIYRKFLESGVDKSSVIVGMGGGITCDIAGFASATFYRGTRLVLVPTTLLAMADAAIGGKNGVNFENHKNIIGTIRQPEKIIIDTEFLRTLPEDEIRNGMAEVIKQCIISEEELFNKIDNPGMAENIFKGIFPEDLLKRVVHIKTEIVKADEFENSRRRALNFGHTLGHIIELKQGIKHGESVAIGMMMSLKLSAHMGKCSHDTCLRVNNLLRLYNLPVETFLDISEIVSLLEFDKKKTGNNIQFVFVNDIGKVYDEPIAIDILIKSLLEVFARQV